MDDMDDPVLDFFDKQQAAFVAEIERITRGLGPYKKKTADPEMGMETTEETLEELIRLSDEIRAAKERHEERKRRSEQP